MDRQEAYWNNGYAFYSYNRQPGPAVFPAYNYNPNQNVSHRIPYGPRPNPYRPCHTTLSGPSLCASSVPFQMMPNPRLSIMQQTRVLNSPFHYPNQDIPRHPPSRAGPNPYTNWNATVPSSFAFGSPSFYGHMTPESRSSYPQGRVSNQNQGRSLSKMNSGSQKQGMSSTLQPTTVEAPKPQEPQRRRSTSILNPQEKESLSLNRDTLNSQAQTRADKDLKATVTVEPQLPNAVIFKSQTIAGQVSKTPQTELSNTITSNSPAIAGKASKPPELRWNKKTTHVSEPHPPNALNSQTGAAHFSIIPEPPLSNPISMNSPTVAGKVSNPPEPQLNKNVLQISEPHLPIATTLNSQTIDGKVSKTLEPLLLNPVSLHSQTISRKTLISPEPHLPKKALEVSEPQSSSPAALTSQTRSEKVVQSPDPQLHKTLEVSEPHPTNTETLNSLTRSFGLSKSLESLLFRNSLLYSQKKTMEVFKSPESLPRDSQTGSVEASKRSEFELTNILTLNPRATEFVSKSSQPQPVSHPDLSPLKKEVNLTVSKPPQPKLLNTHLLNYQEEAVDVSKPQLPKSTEAFKFSESLPQSSQSSSVEASKCSEFKLPNTPTLNPRATDFVSKSTEPQPLSTHNLSPLKKEVNLNFSKPSKFQLLNTCPLNFQVQEKTVDVSNPPNPQLPEVDTLCLQISTLEISKSPGPFTFNTGNLNSQTTEVEVIEKPDGSLQSVLAIDSGIIKVEDSKSFQYIMPKTFSSSPPTVEFEAPKSSEPQRLKGDSLNSQKSTVKTIQFEDSKSSKSQHVKGADSFISQKSTVEVSKLSEPKQPSTDTLSNKTIGFEDSKSTEPRLVKPDSLNSPKSPEEVLRFTEPKVPGIETWNQQTISFEVSKSSEPQPASIDFLNSNTLTVDVLESLRHNHYRVNALNSQKRRVKDILRDPRKIKIKTYIFKPWIWAAAYSMYQNFPNDDNLITLTRKKKVVFLKPSEPQILKAPTDKSQIGNVGDKKDNQTQTDKTENYVMTKSIETQTIEYGMGISNPKVEMISIKTQTDWNAEGSCENTGFGSTSPVLCNTDSGMMSSMIVSSRDDLKHKVGADLVEEKKISAHYFTGNVGHAASGRENQRRRDLNDVYETDKRFICSLGEENRAEDLRQIFESLEAFSIDTRKERISSTKSSHRNDHLLAVNSVSSQCHKSANKYYGLQNYLQRIVSAGGYPDIPPGDDGKSCASRDSEQLNTRSQGGDASKKTLDRKKHVEKSIIDSRDLESYLFSSNPQKGEQLGHQHHNISTELPSKTLPLKSQKTTSTSSVPSIDSNLSRLKAKGLPPPIRFGRKRESSQVHKGDRNEAEVETVSKSNTTSFLNKPTATHTFNVNVSDEPDMNPDELFDDDGAYVSNMLRSYASESDNGRRTMDLSACPELLRNHVSGKNSNLTAIDRMDFGKAEHSRKSFADNSLTTSATYGSLPPSSFTDKKDLENTMPTTTSKAYCSNGAKSGSIQPLMTTTFRNPDTTVFKQSNFPNLSMQYAVDTNKFLGVGGLSQSTVARTLSTNRGSTFAALSRHGASNKPRRAVRFLTKQAKHKSMVGKTPDYMTWQVVSNQKKMKMSPNDIQETFYHEEKCANIMKDILGRYPLLARHEAEEVLKTIGNETSYLQDMRQSHILQEVDTVVARLFPDLVKREGTSDDSKPRRELGDTYKEFGEEKKSSHTVWSNFASTNSFAVLELNDEAGSRRRQN